MTREEIERIVSECVEELFARDLCLLEADVSERAITHKLAEYLQRRMPYLNVDCEYNRNTTAGAQAPKRVNLLRGKTRNALAAALTEDDRLGVSTYPDIIVHRRMTNEENLLVVEVKKENSQVGHGHDRSKLEAFTENTDQNSYHFKYGVFIVFQTGRRPPRKPMLTWFVEGSEVPQE
jgi:hypothetical protein